MFFQLKTGSQGLGIISFLEENQKLAQVWTTRLPAAVKSTCTLWCVYSQKWMSLWLLSSDLSSFPKQKLMCRGVVSIQVLFWEAVGMWPRCPPEKKDCRCHYEECYSDKLVVLSTQPLGSACRNVLLKLSESAVLYLIFYLQLSSASCCGICCLLNQERLKR